MRPERRDAISLLPQTFPTGSQASSSVNPAWMRHWSAQAGEGHWNELCVHQGTSASVPEEGPWAPQLVGTRRQSPGLGFREPSAPALVSQLASQLVWCLRRKAGVRSGKSANRLATNMLPRPGASAQHGISGSSLRGRLLCCPSQFSKQFFFPFLNVSL